MGIQGGGGREWSYERDGARYEGEVIQLLSNLGATLLGGEPMDGVVGMWKGKARSCRSLLPPSSTIEPR